MKIFGRIYSLLGIFLISLSCVFQLELIEKDEVHTFIAQTDCDTKTVLNEHKSLWTGEEYIQVIGRNGNYRFSSYSDTPSASAEFSYTGTFDENEVLAVYPAGSSNYGADLATKTVTGVSIPTIQNAVAGSYDPQAQVAVAYSTDNTLCFRNAVSLLKFTVGSSGVSNVTFHANGQSVSGTATIEYNDGEPLVSGFEETYVELQGTFEQGKTYYMAVCPGTYEKGIGIEFNKYPCKSKDSSVEFKRSAIYNLGTITFPDSYTKLPDGAKHGINYNSDGSVTLVLYEKDNQGWHYDSCHVLGDFNSWSKSDQYEMKRDDDAGVWWITLSGLDPKTEYRFQYELTAGESVVRVHDPYSEIVYDEHNDKYISTSTYYGLPSYPSGAWNNISAFQIQRQDDYTWQVSNFKIEDKDDVIIYEMLLRDFSSSRDIHGALAQLDYLQTLGIEAIELMPVQEFDGNLSWGYNPCSYFALDKAYGTRWDYKHFIDECHKRGIGVIVDVTYNHATGSHPYAKLYWDSTNNKTSWTNPFFNESAPHGWSVYHDWNHSNPMVRDHIKRSLEYLLTEYKVDGFRFDLSKGFTQNSGTDSSYDEQRVGYLKEYNYHIQCVNPNAIMICEHFCDAENWELGNNGIKVWRNVNSQYGQAAMGHSNNASFYSLRESDGVRFGTFVGYMESHDEERLGYKASQWGTDRVKADYTLRLKRAELNAAFFLLVPGPKMIWQFGEIGYDISLEYGGSNTAEKPLKTEEYMANEYRKKLYDTYAALISFRNENPRFFDNDADFRWYVGDTEWPGRYLFCKDADGRNFALFGNFGYGDNTISVSLPHDGKWYNWFDHTDASAWNGSSHNVPMQEGQFYLLTDF